MLDDIIYHRKDPKTVTSIPNGYINTENYTRAKKSTTRVCQLRVKRRYGYITWVELKDLKESYIVELDECDINNGISKEPDIACWFT